MLCPTVTQIHLLEKKCFSTKQEQNFQSMTWLTTAAPAHTFIVENDGEKGKSIAVTVAY